MADVTLYNTRAGRLIFLPNSPEEVKLVWGKFNPLNLDECKLGLNKTQFESLKKREFFKRCLDTGILTDKNPKQIIPEEKKLRKPPERLRSAKVKVKDGGTVEIAGDQNADEDSNTFKFSKKDK